MNELDSPNYFEYSYEKRAYGKNLLARIALISSYVLFLLGAFLLCYLSGLIPLFAIAPMLLWILVFFTYRLVKYDVYYEFHSGNLTLGKIYNCKRGRQKKPKIAIKVKDATEILYLKDASEKNKGARLYDFSSHKNAEGRILVRFYTPKRFCAAIFDGGEKIEKLLRSFCQSCKLKNK